MHFYGGKIFAFTLCLKQIFWAQQNLGGHKTNLGSTAPECPRGYGPACSCCRPVCKHAFDSFSTSSLLSSSVCLSELDVLIGKHCEYFIPISSIHSHSTRLATSNNLFLPRVNSSSGKCSLTFVGPKVWCSILNDIKSSTTFTFKWKLKKHLLRDKDTPL